MKPVPILAASVCAGVLCILPAQTIEAVPNHVLTDESAVIRATGLQPNERITVRAELVDGAQERWTAQADFIADAQGVVDASKQAPVAGSYKEVSAMGLIWSMLPASKNTAAYRPPENLGPQAVDLRLMRKGEQIAAARLVQAAVGEGVRRVVVHDGALRGALFLPAEGRGPGVLVVGGSNGGVPGRQAAWLASRGFVALALAYFHYEDLPANLEAIPLEYFQEALAWMADRPEIVGSRLAVMGTSRGGELALQLGSMFPKIGAVVAYVPANVRYPACCGGNRVPFAWTWRKTPLPYVPLQLSRNPQAVRDAAIEVENTRGPILMISGEDDEVWRSWEMAAAVVTRLKMAHFPYAVEHLEYRGAGHAAGRPDIAPAWHGRVTHPVSGREMNLGGTPKGDAQSSLDAMPRVLAFLRRNLQPAGIVERGPQR